MKLGLKINKSLENLNKEILLVNISLFFLYIIVLWQLLSIGFTTCDDMTYYLVSGDLANYGEFAKGIAKHQGRFGFSIVLWINTIPYLIDSSIWHGLCLAIPIGVSFVLFSKLIQKAFKNKVFALLISIILISTMQIMGKTHLTTTHPIFFALGFSLIIYSLILHLDYYEKHKYYILIISSIVSFISFLFYEVFLVYFLFFFLISIWKNNLFYSFTKQNFIKTLKELIPYIITGIIFLVFYILFRYYNNPDYIGSQLSSNLDLIGVFRFSHLLSTYSLPLSTYNLYQDLFIRLSPYSDSLFYLYRSDLLSLIISLIVFGLSYFLLGKYNKTNYKNYIISLLSGVLFFYLPLLFLSFSKRYSLLALDSYIVSLFSFFGVSLIIVSILLLIYNFVSHKKYISIISKIIISFVLFFFVLITQIGNRNVIKDLKASNLRYEITKDVFSNPITKDINPKAIFCFEELFTSTSTLENNALSVNFNWSYFVYRSIQRTLLSYNTYSELYNSIKDKKEFEDRDIYITYFSQTTKTYEGYILLAKLKGSELKEDISQILSSEIILGYYSPFKSFRLSIATDGNEEVWVNNMKMNSEGNCHQINVPSYLFKKGDKISYLKIKGKNLKPNTLIISNILLKQENIDFRVNLQKGKIRRNEIRGNIISSPDWYKAIEEKAKKNNTTTQKQIESDIDYFIQNETVDIHR